MNLMRIMPAIILLLLIPTSYAARVHGTIYAWSDFEKPLRNVIVEVNSTPAQSIVATDGTYSFELPPGSYRITARYYQNNVLVYYDEEDIRIDREGNFTIDLLLFPPTGSEYEFLGDINLTDVELKNNDNKYVYTIFLIIPAIIIYWLLKKKTGNVETSTELPEDLSNLLEVILKSGGRVTQKELRKKLSCSEAKISLMISDLEDRGLIKKIKKGRSNIIIAQK